MPGGLPPKSNEGRQVPCNRRQSLADRARFQKPDHRSRQPAHDGRQPTSRAYAWPRTTTARYARHPSLRRTRPALQSTSRLGVGWRVLDTMPPMSSEVSTFFVTGTPSAIARIGVHTIVEARVTAAAVAALAVGEEEICEGHAASFGQTGTKPARAARSTTRAWNENTSWQFRRHWVVPNCRRKQVPSALVPKQSPAVILPVAIYVHS